MKATIKVHQFSIISFSSLAILNECSIPMKVVNRINPNMHIPGLLVIPFPPSTYLCGGIVWQIIWNRNQTLKMSSSEDIISIFWKWSDCAPWASAVVSGFLFKVIYLAKNIKCEDIIRVSLERKMEKKPTSHHCHQQRKPTQQNILRSLELV